MEDLSPQNFNSVKLQLIEIFMVLCSETTRVVKMLCSVPNAVDLQGKLCAVLKMFLFRRSACLSSTIYQAAAYNSRAD